MQIIKIIQPGDAKTVGRNHRNISKVTLASPDDKPGLKKRYNSVASTVNVTTIKNCNETADRRVEEMKTSIMKMMEDKETVMRENTTLRRYKENVESLSKENARLKQELSKLRSLVDGCHEVNNNELPDVNLSDLEKWLLSTSSQRKSAICDKCNENIFKTPESNNVKKCNSSQTTEQSTDHLQSLTRELLLLFLFSKLKS